MRTDCIVKLSKLHISELNTLVQKETSGDVEGNLLLSDRHRSCLSHLLLAAIVSKTWILCSMCSPPAWKRLEKWKNPFDVEVWAKLA
jgi:hypothetical protein